MVARYLNNDKKGETQTSSISRKFVQAKLVYLSISLLR